MLTWYLQDTPTASGDVYREGNILSTDSKPTGGDLANGSKLLEMDTAKLYSYNKDGEAWVEWA